MISKSNGMNVTQGMLKPNCGVIRHTEWRTRGGKANHPGARLTTANSSPVRSDSELSLTRRLNARS